MLGQPPFDAGRREQRHQGEPRTAWGNARTAARSTLDVHARDVGVAAHSMRARRHYRRSSPGKTGALSTGSTPTERSPAGCIGIEVEDREGCQLWDRSALCRPGTQLAAPSL